MSATFITLSLVLAFIFITVGWLKINRQKWMRDSAEHLGYSIRGFQAIGVTEVAAGGGLVFGQFWTPAGVAAAIGLVALLIGAVVSIRRAGDGVRDMVPALWIGILTGITAALGIASA